MKTAKRDPSCHIVIVPAATNRLSVYQSFVRDRNIEELLATDTTSIMKIPPASKSLTHEEKIADYRAPMQSRVKVLMKEEEALTLGFFNVNTTAQVAAQSQARRPCKASASTTNGHEEAPSLFYNRTLSHEDINVVDRRGVPPIASPAPVPLSFFR